MTSDDKPVDSGRGGLFGLFKRRTPATGAAEGAESAPSEPTSPPGTSSLFGRLRARLARTREGLVGGLADLFLGKKQIDAEVLEELEMRLLTADVGVEATSQIISRLTERASRRQLADVPALLLALREEMLALLEPCTSPLEIPRNVRPYVILMVGVNGVGKTTTIGKLTKRLQANAYSVMLAAGDTFRAAAIEQLQVWGERNGVPVIAQSKGSDSASVVFDAFHAARARRVDVLIADTAGRLHTQSNLMEELRKIRRVLGRLDPAAPHEVMLVVDAGTGQNALNQARQFHEAVGLTGITLTKLDGTAKGGIILAIAGQLKVPIQFIGVGESIEDLRPFDAGEFVDALLAPSDEAGAG